MADLDRYDLDDRYLGPCLLCEGDMWDDGDNDWLGKEYVHRVCKEEAEREYAEMLGEWEAERGTE